jgi:hypothetical protein
LGCSGGSSESLRDWRRKKPRHRDLLAVCRKIFVDIAVLVNPSSPILRYAVLDNEEVAIIVDLGLTIWREGQESQDLLDVRRLANPAEVAGVEPLHYSIELSQLEANINISVV